MTGETLALDVHVITAQFAESVGHKFGSNALAPGHIEIGVVQRLGDASREGGSFSDSFRIQGTPQQKFRSPVRNQRAGRRRAYYDSRILDHTLTGKTRRGSDG
jgi:hypothetical protein